MTLRRGRRTRLREAGPQLIPSLSDPDKPTCRKAPVSQRQRETERGEPREGESNSPDACCDPPSLRYCPPRWEHLKKAMAPRAGSRICLWNAASLSGLRTFWILQLGLSLLPGTRQPSDGIQTELSHLCRLPSLSPSPLSMPFCSPRIRATRTTGYLTFSNALVCGFKVK